MDSTVEKLAPLDKFGSLNFLDQKVVASWRLILVFWTIFLLLGFAIISFASTYYNFYPLIILVGSFLFILLWVSLVVFWPNIRFKAWGYRISNDYLYVKRGSLWQQEIIVPMIRVQYVNLRQGPIQSHYRLASIIVHTAGVANVMVVIPGLNKEEAKALRDQIAELCKEENAS